ncbi:hypothetical protein BH23PLA1_BH23PLA1_07600 [soil metagenome]
MRPPSRSNRRTFAFAMLLGLLSACSPEPIPSVPERPDRGPDRPRLDLPPIASSLSSNDSETSGDAGPRIRFREVATAAGIDFVHHSGYDDRKHFPTWAGSGVALLDSDLDGRLDIYFACTRALPLSEPDDRSLGNRLYRNLGDGRFEDVTVAAGIDFRGFCHGVVAGDIDGDGFPDLFLTNLGPDRLYLNNGDGTFRDATEGAGLDAPPWSTGAALLDFDGDGRLDLYVTCYSEWTYGEEPPNYANPARQIRVFASPLAMRPERHYLYRNRGDGTFEDVTEAAGILRFDGRGLGVVAADIDLDGRIDLYVANDASPNFLFLNNGDGTFTDASETSGTAVSARGEVQGSMGVDAEDINGDGWPELFTTNFRAQYNALYLNYDGRYFQDITGRSGTVSDSQFWVGWGCALADFDNDGRPDLFVVNGEVDDNLPEAGVEIPFAQPSFVWKGQADGTFRLVSQAGPFFDQTHPARGAAFGDLNDDGRLDVVISILDRPPAVLINDSKAGNWVRFDLIGTASNRAAIGARVEVHIGDRVIHRQVKGGGSYLSSSDPRVLVGLGDSPSVDRVVIRWPSGTISEQIRPEIGRTHLVREPRDEPK